MIVKPSAVTTRCVIVIEATFPSMTISASGSTGIAWFDSQNHNLVFPFDFANENFFYKLARVRTTESHHVPWPQAGHQLIDLQLFCVDSSGADFGGGTCLAEWMISDGAGGTNIVQGALDAISQPGQTGTLANVAGIRFQYTVQYCTSTLTLPSPLQIVVSAANLTQM